MRTYHDSYTSPTFSSVVVQPQTSSSKYTFVRNRKYYYLSLLLRNILINLRSKSKFRISISWCLWLKYVAEIIFKSMLSVLGLFADVEWIAFFLNWSSTLDMVDLCES